MTAPRRVVVVGAGAAGLLATIWAAREARSTAHPAEVVLLERTRDGGRKILVSGGGRCNILPRTLQPERFVTDSSPRTLRNVLRSWPLPEQKAFFEQEVGLRLVLEESTGKWFPDTHHAKDVRDALVDLARREGARIEFGCRVEDVRSGGETWRVSRAGAPPIEADGVVLATGGLSVPATGSDGFGLGLARRLGHRIVEPYPALTPLLGGDARHHALSGVSVHVRLRTGSDRHRETATGGLLFTHGGFSGPAVLDLSHVAVRSAEADRARILVSWAAADREHWERLLTDSPGRATVGSRLRRGLPDRVVALLADEAGMPRDQPLSGLSRTGRRALIDGLVDWPLPWSGHEGYRKAEVTGGGVHLAEVDPRTLQSRRHRGLFLCGEMLDAFGPIGGHNFAWAWATGRLAGRGAVAD